MYIYIYIYMLCREGAITHALYRGAARVVNYALCRSQESGYERGRRFRAGGG